MPGLAALVWGMMFKENLSKYLGEHATMFLSIDGAVFSVMLYRLALREKVQAVMAFSAIPHGHRTASVVSS
ncbi:hypothetical protein AAVH_30632 [Aphelenchoides avenae]|nr:hypothetical protein AAVH_30632 [Aphelenchus avenae]